MLVRRRGRVTVLAAKDRAFSRRLVLRCIAKELPRCARCLVLPYRVRRKGLF